MDGMDKFHSDMAAINARVDQLIRERAELRGALERLSVVIHHCEARGVELSKTDDEAWSAVKAAGYAARSAAEAARFAAWSAAWSAEDAAPYAAARQEWADLVAEAFE